MFAMRLGNRQDESGREDRVGEEFEPPFDGDAHRFERNDAPEPTQFSLNAGSRRSRDRYRRWPNHFSPNPTS